MLLNSDPRRPLQKNLLTHLHRNRQAVPPDSRALLEAIDAIAPEAVVFDLFDTLLVRDVHPDDVKRIACDRIARVLGTISGKTLHAERMSIEAGLRRENAAQGHDAEFCFDAMAGRLAEAARRSGAGMARDRLVALIGDSELAVEASVQHVDEPMRDVLAALYARNTPLYLLSDFYLGETAMRRVLDEHGILHFFDAVFISCDTLQTKHSGRAYQRLLAHTQRPAARMLMIGDNRESDVHQARAHGLNALLLDRAADAARYHKAAAAFEDATALAAQVRAQVSTSKVAGEDTVFRELSLSLYFFVQSLHARLVEKGAGDVFFLSREGQLLKRLFDRYQAHARFEGECFVKTHYFESSRRASFMPSLGPIESETFETLFRQYRRISLAEFLLNLGLDDQLDRFRALLGPNFDERSDDLPSSEGFRRLMNDAGFRAIYAARREEQIDGFGQYLKSFLRRGANRTLHLVDVGWKGTIQDNIFQILTRNLPDTPFDEVEGFYVALLEPGRAGERNRKHGLLFDTLANHVAAYPAFNENRSLFEVLLAADHGSAKAYRIDETGCAMVERQTSDDELNLFYSKVQAVQVDIERQFEQLCECLLRHRWTHAELLDMAARAHARMVFSPTRGEVEWFRTAWHLENFGVFELNTFRAQALRHSFTTRMQTTLHLLKGGPPRDLGVWPWLTLHDQTLALLPLAYKLFRHGQLRRRRKLFPAISAA
ncbi:HAD family hydrolase [Paraburkholderia bannensis]|uniref:HAD family hydrolase n=1 Tax=Paraburkholderia bannensis TaxID=765414 RepID=UPI002AB7F1E1|nr:HAD family hydrolase [Paraburkholderia bannensis]